MSDSGKPTYQNPNKTTMPQQPTPPPPPTTTTDNKRLCDYCYTATAVLYCRADTAKLCLSCDREVHFTNQLFSKHARSQLCDSCDASPASIFCETEQSVFCQNCDWEKHSVNGCLVHTRRPFEGFSGCPSVSELMGVLGVEDLGYYNKKGLVCSEGNDDWIDGYEDLLFWKTPAVVSIDDLMTGHDSYDHGGLNFLALGVPPLPKNRNAVCGQHKEQVLHQLRELSRSELNTNIESDTVPSNMLQSLDAAHPKYIDAVCGIDTQPTSVAKEEENLLQWFPDPGDDSNQAFVPSLLPDSDFRKSSTIPVKQSNVSGNPNQTNDVQGTELDHSVRVRTSSALPKISSHEPNSQERDSAISRYKEKRKTRRYDKHIRYESRKVRAESRIRVRGRFAKVDP